MRVNLSFPSDTIPEHAHNGTCSFQTILRHPYPRTRNLYVSTVAIISSCDNSNSFSKTAEKCWLLSFATSEIIPRASWQSPPFSWANFSSQKLLRGFLEPVALGLDLPPHYILLVLLHNATGPMTAAPNLLGLRYVPFVIPVQTKSLSPSGDT